MDCEIQLKCNHCDTELAKPTLLYDKIFSLKHNSHISNGMVFSINDEKTISNDKI